MNTPIRSVHVVFPSSPVPDLARFEAGLAWLRAEGIAVSLSPPASAGPLPFLAGPDLARAQALAGAFAVERVDAVWCARGGTGALRTLSALEAVEAWAEEVEARREATLRAPGHPVPANHQPSLYAADRRHVPLVGLSDATALLLARLGDRVPGLAIHGPVVTQLTRLDVASADALRTWLAAPGQLPVVRTEDPRVVVPGRVEGRLVAGNLALFASVCGTSQQPVLRGAIWLVEEIAEPGYRVDRMMAQLHRSGALAGLAGFAVGQLEACGPEVVDCLAWWGARLDVPTLIGLPVGHGGACMPVALGLRYLLSPGDGLLAPLESTDAWLARTGRP